MFPWVYEFHWTVFHITFLLIFFVLFISIVSTLITAILKSRNDFHARSVDHILWHSDFEDLSPASRVCRHELNGEVQHRTCNNGFDCRTCTAHPSFVAKKESTKQKSVLQFEVFGFIMPPYRMYHRGHTWVQQEKDGTYKVGLDDFGERIIGKYTGIDLPPVGTQLHVSGIGWHVQKENARLRILSPLDGEVVEHGDKEKGWFLKIKPKNSSNGTTHLLHGSEIRPWLMREMERLQMSFATNGIGVTLADGGELVPDFHKYFPKADWDGILGQMFLEG